MSRCNDDLDRIAEQANLLTDRARELNELYYRLHDQGRTSPSSHELAEATRRLQAAFMAVLRVTAACL